MTYLMKKKQFDKSFFKVRANNTCCKYWIASNKAMTDNRHNDTSVQPQTQAMGAAR